MLDAPDGSLRHMSTMHSALPRVAATASAATTTMPTQAGETTLRAVESPMIGYRAPDLVGERTILVAEDDYSCRSALHHYFERTGYRVTEAADGPSSLRAVFQHSADLVILDLGLPGVDGPEVLAKIRRHSAVPVIVCSGRDSEEERIRMLNLGADDFVVKPFSFAELEARVRAVLRRGNSEPTTTRMEHGGLIVDRDTRTVM